MTTVVVVSSMIAGPSMTFAGDHLLAVVDRVTSYIPSAAAARAGSIPRK
jgi:hypothetical protein